MAQYGHHGVLLKNSGILQSKCYRDQFVMSSIYVYEEIAFYYEISPLVKKVDGEIERTANMWNNQNCIWKRLTAFLWYLSMLYPPKIVGNEGHIGIISAARSFLIISWVS